MINFETSPDRYRHWKLTLDGPVATLSMDVQEDQTLATGYKLKLNSYDLGVDIELADAIRRMTSLPCETFGLTDRGVIRPGALADLVLFDPATIADVGTYQDPAQPPTGIAAVIVNGEVVVRDGEHTGARPGRTLRR